MLEAWHMQAAEQARHRAILSFCIARLARSRAYTALQQWQYAVELSRRSQHASIRMLLNRHFRTLAESFAAWVLVWRQTCTKQANLHKAAAHDFNRTLAKVRQCHFYAFTSPICMSCCAVFYNRYSNYPCLISILKPKNLVPMYVWVKPGPMETILMFSYICRCLVTTY